MFYYYSMVSTYNNENNENNENDENDENIELFCYNRYDFTDLDEIFKIYEILVVYNIEMKKTNSDFIEVKDIVNVDRTDTLFLELFRKHSSQNNQNDQNNQNNDKNKLIIIKSIPKKYEKYYTICKINNLESIEINYEKYKLDKFKQEVKNILFNNNNCEDKIIQLKNIIC